MRLLDVLPLALLVVTAAGCLSHGPDGPGATSAPTPLASDVPPPETFSGTASHAPSPVRPATASPNGTPAAHVVVVDTGMLGGEPSIGVTSTGSVFSVAVDAVPGDEFTIRSKDRAASWESVYDFYQDVDGYFVHHSVDPMLWVDPVTDRVFTSHLYQGACTSLVWSDDDGASWFLRDGACAIPITDHQKVTSGVPGPNAPPAAGVAYPTVLYVCYQQRGATVECIASYDGGLSFPVVAHPLTYLVDQCAGLTGRPAVSPTGVVALPAAWLCSHPRVAVSDDSGLTWTVRDGPDVEAEGLDPDVEYAPDGSLYLLWTAAGDHLPRLARSTDDGTTWQGPWIVAPPGVNSTAFGALTAGADGRLAIAFLGTRASNASAWDVDPAARWNLFVVTTDDATAADPVFVAHQATADLDPVQIGPICMLGDGCHDGTRNLLDFIDAGSGRDGTFYVSFTDGCTKDCAGRPEATQDDSRSTEVAVARLDGWTLRPSASV